MREAALPGVTNTAHNSGSVSRELLVQSSSHSTSLILEQVLEFCSQQLWKSDLIPRPCDSVGSKTEGCDEDTKRPSVFRETAALQGSKSQIKAENQSQRLPWSLEAVPLQDPTSSQPLTNSAISQPLNAPVSPSYGITTQIGLRG